MTRLLPAWFALVLSAGAPAQDPPPAPPAPAEADRRRIEELVSILEDETEREALIERLRLLLSATEPEPPPPAGGPLAGVVNAVAIVSGRLGEAGTGLIEQAGAVPGRLRALGERLRDPGARDALLADTGWVAASLLLGLAAFYAVAFALRGWVRSLSRAPLQPRALFARIAIVAGRALLRLAPCLALLPVSLLATGALAPSEGAGLVAGALLFAVALRRVATVLIDLLFCKDGSQVRLLPIGDDHAHRLRRHLQRFASVAIWGQAILACARVLGADPDLTAALGNLYGVTLVVLAILIVLAERKPVHAALQRWVDHDPEQPHAAPSLARRLAGAVAAFWWPLAILYVLALFGVWASGAPGGAWFVLRTTVWSALAIAAAFALALALRALLGPIRERIMRQFRNVPELRLELPRYVRWLQIGIEVVIAVVAGGFLLELWGAEGIATLLSEPVRAIAATLVQILLILLAAAVTVDAVTILTRRFLEHRERLGRATSRTRTLVPLMRAFAKVAITTIAVLMVLSTIGIEMGPLLAGVGIIGLALGFGAQTLVKDVITGFFILLEDSMSVGDICMVNGTGGLVEAITLRSVRLRDLQGTVHTIPFSSVSTVSNMTMDFSHCVVDVPVAYHENVDEVLTVVHRIGEEMRADPALSSDILEPIEMIGLDQFGESAVVLRARFKTKTASQWKVGREFNIRMKREFDRLGIEIPFPYRTVVLRDPDHVVRDGAERAAEPDRKQQDR
jgi:small conductance mechanosensitive channel